MCFAVCVGGCFMIDCFLLVLGFIVLVGLACCVVVG